LFPYSPHSPDYVVDLAAIGFGAKVASHVMLELLGAGSSLSHIESSGSKT
jgi:hippurate hydrolase